MEGSGRFYGGFRVFPGRFRVFPWKVLGVSGKVPGVSGKVPGVSGEDSGCFWEDSGCFWGGSGCFRGGFRVFPWRVPGISVEGSGCFRGGFWVFPWKVLGVSGEDSGCFCGRFRVFPGRVPGVSGEGSGCRIVNVGEERDHDDSSGTCGLCPGAAAALRDPGNRKTPSLPQRPSSGASPRGRLSGGGDGPSEGRRPTTTGRPPELLLVRMSSFRPSCVVTCIFVFIFISFFQRARKGEGQRDGKVDERAHPSLPPARPPRGPSPQPGLCPDRSRTGTPRFRGGRPTLSPGRGVTSRLGVREAATPAGESNDCNAAVLNLWAATPLAVEHAACGL
ncbi:PREDICTED: protein SPT2 homolog isoform X4 [Myotis brandtii]|uniref:protein SPT2 homolog isoform X4 n=1 Tax=Myotis brandtii TaxID=109478 RepID=UPI000703D229|nr:PREDICTED: protein SPT2 homolog isoform X4 [Myotis brandtii]